MNTEKLTGKVIVITGAASGMGAAMAKDFSAREAKVAILDMNEEKAQEVIKEIEAAGGVATFYLSLIHISEPTRPQLQM